jgi:hypothetical protein
MASQEFDPMKMTENVLAQPHVAAATLLNKEQRKTAAKKTSDPAAWLGSEADKQQWADLQRRYQEPIVLKDSKPDNEFRGELAKVVGNDLVKQQDLVRNVITRAENIARKNKYGDINDDTFNAALKELNINELPENIAEDLKVRANQRYIAAGGLYTMRKRLGVIENNNNPNQQTTKTNEGDTKVTNPKPVQPKAKSSYAPKSAIGINAEIAASKTPKPETPKKTLGQMPEVQKQLQDIRRETANKYDLPVESVPANLPFVKPVKFDYAMPDGKVVKGEVTPSVFDTPQDVEKQKRKAITKSRFNYAYSPTTELPLGIEYGSKDKGKAEQEAKYLTIGDVNKAEKDLQLEFISKFSGAMLERANQTGNKELTLAQAKAIANQLVPMMNQDQDEGLIDYIYNIGDRPGKWRNAMFQFFGADSEFESAVGQDEVLQELYNTYKGRVNDVQNLRGAKAQFKGKVPLGIFKTTNNPLDAKNRISAEVALLDGALSWTHSGVKNFIERLGTEAQKEAYAIDGGDKAQEANWENVFTGGIANAASVEELRTIVLQNEQLRKQLDVTEQSGVNTIMTAIASLYGNLKTGGLRIGGAATSGGIKLAQLGGKALEKTEVFNRAANLVKNTKFVEAATQSKTVQNVARFLSKSPELGDGLRTAATFIAADLVESMPTATDEDLINAAGKGMLFGIAGTAMAERVVFPFMMRNNAYQKLLSDPKFAAQVDAEAGVGATQILLSRVAQQKEVAYALGNALANPFQDYIAANLEGQEYDAAQFAISLLSGGMMGLEFARQRGKFKKENPGQFEFTEDDYVAMAAAEKVRQDQADAAETEAKTIKEDAPTQSGDAPQQPQDATTESARDNTRVDENPDVVAGEPDVDAIEAELREEVLRRSASAETDFQSVETKANEETTVTETTYQQRKSEIEGFETKLTDTQKMVLGIVEPMVNDVKIVYHNGDTQYDPEAGVIYIDNKLRNTDAEINAIVHESVHHGTYKLIESDPAFRNAVKALQRKTLNSRFFQKWAAENPTEAAYMAGDTHEFFVGFVDNKHGIGDLIERNSRSTGSHLVELASRVFGTSQTTSKDALSAFRDLTTNIKAPEPIPDEAVIDAALQDLTSMQQGITDEPVYPEGQVPVAGSKLGLFKDFQKVLELRKIRDANTQQQAIQVGAKFIAEMDRMGIRDEVGLAYIYDRMVEQNPHWPHADPLTKAQDMLKFVTTNDGGITAAEIETLRSESDVTASQDEINSYDWLKSPSLDKRVLATLLGAERVSVLESELNRGLANPEQLLQDFPTKVVEALERTPNINDERIETARTKARDFVHDYVNSHSNVAEVEPLGVKQNLDGTFSLTSYKNLKRDPSSQQKLQTTVQNPTGMLRRLENVKNEIFTLNGDVRNQADILPHFNLEHLRLANILAAPRFGNVTNSKLLTEKNMFTNSEDVGNTLLDTGWFFLPKGTQGNIFFNLSEMMGPMMHGDRQLSVDNAVNTIKRIEEMNVTHFLTSERLHGIGTNGAIKSALGAIDLWKMVDLARNNKTLTEQDAIESFLRPEILEKDKWVEAAKQRAPQLIAEANETIKRLAKYYEANESGYRPEILHEHAKNNPNERNIGAALATAVNHFYHKVFDHGNVNDLIRDPNSNKYMKLQAKYMGVQTQMAYKKMKDATIASALLQSKNSSHLPMDIRSLTPDKATEAAEYWRTKGFFLDNDGNVKLKQFVMSDEWAEANPEIWARLSGQEFGVKAQTGATKLVGDTQYVVKDQAKADKANKFIGRGSNASSTAKYAASFGELANTGNYTPKDVVFISAEGNRSGRVAPDFDEIGRAIDAGATFITDVKADRERPYNLGEREVAEYLGNREYKEVQPGVWKIQLDESTPKKLVPPSKYYDGATLMINKGTHDALAELNNMDPNQTGAIKYGYGGDFIYKSDFTPRYQTGDPVVDSWFESLRQQGISTIAVQSAIKSKARNYKRTAEEPGKVAVHDDDGSLLGFEVNGKFTSTPKEERAARYTNASAPVELVKEYDLVGQNAIGLANTAKVNENFANGVAFGLDRTPYSVFDDDNSRTLNNTFQRLQANKLYDFVDVYAGYKRLIEDQGIVRDSKAANVVRSMIEAVRNMDESDVTFGDADTQKSVLRTLENALLDGNSVNIGAIRALDAVYPQILRGDKKIKPLARRVVINALDAADKSASLGKSYRLSPYVPSINHAQNGIDASLYWKEQELRETFEGKGYSKEDVELRVAEGLEVYKQEAAQVIAEHMPNGKLVDYGLGYIQSANEIDAINREIRKRRSNGEKTPYVIVGSKTIGKLTPSDALTSWSGRILVGADTDMNAGMMMNQPFAINSVGRDHDGDGFIIMYENDDWNKSPLYSNSEFLEKTSGNQFQQLHAALVGMNTHVTDEYRELADSKDQPLLSAKGRPFNQRVVDMRVSGLNGIAKTLDANSAAGEDIGTGISTLNNYYEMLRQRGNPDFVTKSVKNGDVKINVVFDLAKDSNQSTRLKINDAYYKQSQYDRYNGLNYNPNEVFLGTRVSNIKIDGDTKGFESLAASIQRFNEQGIVDSELWNTFTSAIQPIKPDRNTLIEKQTGNVVAGQSANIALKVSIGNNEAVKHLNAATSTLKDVYRSAGIVVQDGVDAADKVSKQLKPYAQANAALANFDPFRNIIPDPNKWVDFNADKPGIDPMQGIHIKEMLSRAWSAEHTIIDITPTVSWELASDGVYLRTNESRIPISETVNHKGELHDEVVRLITEDGVALSEIYPRDIIGHVSMADIRVSMNNDKLKGYLQANPDVTVIRLSGVSKPTSDPSAQAGLTDVGRQGEYVRNRNYPNFVQLSYYDKSNASIVSQLNKVIREEVRKGNRVVIDRESLGTVSNPISIPSGILDIGRKVRVDRNYNDQQRSRLAGRFYGANNSELGYAHAIANEVNRLGYVGFEKGVEYLKDNAVLYNIHRGLKDIGANVKTPFGNDVLQEIIYNQIHDEMMADEAPHKMEYNVPVAEREGRRLGLFNGKIGKIKGTALDDAKAGPINRLNKYAGRDVLSLGSDDSDIIIKAVEDYVRGEFPNAPDVDAVIDQVTHAFDPMALRDLETGVWDDVRRNHGELDYKAAKNYTFVQALSYISDIVKGQKRGNVGKFFDKWGFLAAQSVDDMVRLFANDKKVYSGATPVYEMTDVSLTPNGPDVRVRQGLLHQMRDARNKNKPLFAALESGTSIRHTHRHRQLNGIKDAMAQAAAKWRDESMRLFPTGSLFTAEGAEEAMSILNGVDNPFYRDVVETYIDIVDEGAGPLEVPRQRVRREQAQAPIAPVFAVELQHDGMPVVTTTLAMPDGTTRLFMTNAEENGFFSQSDLTDMVRAMMPDQSFQTAGKATRFEIESMLKRGITAKVYNSAIAAYQHSYATTLEQYVQKLRQYNNDIYNQDGTEKQITESAFYDVINQANDLIKELRDEANERYNSSIADNVNAMTYVNYDVMASQLSDYIGRFDSAKPEQKTEMLMFLGGKADALGVLSTYNLAGDVDAETAGKFTLNLLRRRLANANSKNKQLTKTQAFFEQELLDPNERSNSSMYSVIDSKIMQEIFGEPKDYNPDVVFRKNQEVIDGVLNKVNAVFRNAYIREKNVRKASGLDYMESGIAENNFLADLSNDGSVYNRQIDIHSSRGWRQSLHNLHQETGSQFLSPEEIGVNLATPMSITYRSDDNHGVRTINGRLAGVVRLNNKVIMSKGVRELQERMAQDPSSVTPETIQGLLNTKNTMESAADYKDMVVLYNQDSGSLNFVDLGTVTTALSGEVNGRINRIVQSKRAALLEQKFNGADGLGRFLSSDAAVNTLKTLDEQGKIRTVEMFKSATPKNIPFFGEITRDQVPPGAAKIWNGIAAGLTSQSAWMHGYGRQAASVAVGISMLPLAPKTGSIMIGNAIMDGMFKYARNYISNAKSFIGRSMMTEQTTDIATLRDYFTSGIKTVKKGSAVAASAERRITRGVGLDPEITANFKKESEAASITAPLQRQLFELDRIKKHYDGLGRILTDADLVAVGEMIARKTTLRDKVVADIRQGQLTLSLEGQDGRYIRSLNDLYDANLNSLNTMLIGAGKLGKLSMVFGPESGKRRFLNPAVAAAELNNLRLRVWTAQGATEASGVLGAAQKAEQSFNDANAGKIIMDDEVARVNFVNASIDLMQGKFDQRALHLRTPLGRALTLFSQYSQNFNRYTLLEVRKERQFFEDLLSTFADDPEYRNQLITKYGVNIGNQIVQAPLTAFSKDGKVKRNILGYIPQNKAGAYMSSALLINAGIVYLIQQWSGLGGSLGQAAMGKVEQFVEGTTGGQTIVGSAVKAITLGIANSLFYDDSDKKEAKKSDQNIRDAWRDFTWGLPGGVGYTPFKEAIGNFGLYMMYQAGILPEFKAPTPSRLVDQTVAPLIMPVTAVSNIKTGIKKANKLTDEEIPGITKEKKNSKRSLY